MYTHKGGEMRHAKTENRARVEREVRFIVVSPSAPRIARPH